MNKILEARIKTLDSQLANAVVEQIGDDTDDAGSLDKGTYQVFVPGAVREWNQVKAKNREEAIEKTRKVLVSKVEQLESKPGAKNVEVKPDNIKHNTNAQEA